MFGSKYYSPDDIILFKLFMSKQRLCFERQSICHATKYDDILFNYTIIVFNNDSLYANGCIIKPFDELLVCSSFDKTLHG